MRIIAPFLFMNLSLLQIVGLPSYTQAQGKNKKPVAGRADVLRHLPKKYAAFQNCDAKKNTVSIVIEGEKKPTSWKLSPNVEIKVLGWWGRIQQYKMGQRLWVWFAIDRKKKANGILMLADEISEQDIHGEPVTVVANKGNTVSVQDIYDKTRTFDYGLRFADIEFNKGLKLYINSAAGAVDRVVLPKELKSVRSKQKDYLRGQWRKHGLPGMISFLHPLGGEMEIMLDHESKRWGRYLKYGDQIKVAVDGTKSKPIKATVRQVQPWREYTRVTLVTNSGVDQVELTSGQRVHAHVPEPPKDIQKSNLPTDLGRDRPKKERVEWFLASVYCTCSVPGDRCTGMFYSLASCNRNACGNPDFIRRQISNMIDKGMTDGQIFDRLLKTRGPHLLLPHLMK